MHLAAALAATVADLAGDRPRLADLIAFASRDGVPFNDRAVFCDRSGMFRKHMPRHDSLVPAMKRLLQD